MVKKITKYAKFVVCYALILSLIAPSYAALSASDGSAFVTKAEFDSALADFNARLTTFEAGINSKIDSQVTSYLDRNGIWNGASQFPAGSSVIEYSWGYGSANGQWPQSLLEDPEVAYSSGTEYEIVALARSLIPSVTKSGLLYIHSYWGHRPWVKHLTGNIDYLFYGACNRDSTTRAFVYNMDYSDFLVEYPPLHNLGDYNLLDWRIHMTGFAIECQVLLNDVAVISKNLVQGINFLTNVHEAGKTFPIGIAIELANGSGSDFVFVTKGDKVDLNWKVSVTPNTGGNAQVLTYWFYNTKYYNTSMQQTTWKIDDLKVY